MTARRSFLKEAAALAVSAVALDTRSQPAKLPRIGVLANTIPIADLVSGTSTHFAVRELLGGLADRGWIPGKNVEMVWRSAEGDYSKHPRQAQELAATCDVIVVFGPGLEPAMAATRRVPIVMATSGVNGRETFDGVVRIDTLARPGGNVTGLTLSGGSELNGKRLELLKLAKPGIRRVGILGHNLTHASQLMGPRTRRAAEALGIELATYSFESSPDKVEPAFAAMARDGMEAVMVLEVPATSLLHVQAAIHRQAERHRIMVMYETLSAVDSGGLMAYGPDLARLIRRTGHFIDRILRGAKPGDIPIEQPSDFELRVNLKAAKAIGLAVPQSLLMQATRVIE